MLLKSRYKALHLGGIFLSVYILFWERFNVSKFESFKVLESISTIEFKDKFMDL